MKYFYTFLLLLVPALIFSQNFKSFTTTSAVKSIIFDHDTAWVGTTGGIELRDLNGDLIKKFQNVPNIPVGNINTITCDSLGRIWVGTNNGASFFNGTSWSSFSLPRQHVARIAANSSNVYFEMIYNGPYT